MTPRTLRLRSESGDTLVEVLLTVVIVGIAFVALLAGLGTSVRLSGVHRGQANADIAIVSAADAVKTQPYVPCPDVTTASYSPTAGVSLPPGWSASNLTITAVYGWNGQQFTPCQKEDGGLQLVSILATTPDGKSTEAIDVVKRSTT